VTEKEPQRAQQASTQRLTRRRRRSKAADTILLGASAACAAYLLFIALDAQSFTRQFIRAAVGTETTLMVEQWKPIDRIVREIGSAPVSGGDGNVALDFETATGAPAIEQQMHGLLYFRAVYLLWPRRVFVAGPGTVINTGSQLLGASPPADPLWFAEHDISTSFHVNQKAGRLVVTPIGLNAPTTAPVSRP
jgi:hypothetical protein